MGYSSKAGRARTSATAPQAHAICDRCGIRYNHSSLSWQYDWGGASLINKRILVCHSCTDTPQEQLRAIIIPADPIPISNPRPEWFVQDETNYRTIAGSTTDAVTGIPVPNDTIIENEDGSLRVTQQTGFANGSLNQEPGTDPNVTGGDDPGLPYNNVDVPKTGPI